MKLTCLLTTLMLSLLLSNSLMAANDFVFCPGPENISFNLTASDNDTYGTTIASGWQSTPIEYQPSEWQNDWPNLFVIRVYQQNNIAICEYVDNNPASVRQNEPIFKLTQTIPNSYFIFDSENEGAGPLSFCTEATSKNHLCYFKYMQILH